MNVLHKGILSTILALVLTGCASESPSPSTTSSQSEHEERIQAEVVKIIDGDTISVKINGKKDTVRMLLIDTPETKHPSQPVQPFGPEATAFAKKRLNNKHISLEIGTTKRDKYDRLLAYVYVDGTMYNKKVVAKGLARVGYVYPPNDKYIEQLRGAEEKAQIEHKGIWSIDGYVTEEGFREEVIDQQPQQNDQENNNIGDLPYNPNGKDRDCSHFSTQEVAQQFFTAAGGPEQDKHRLDRDGDGIACESLP
ncbi:nuclease [Pontibacillus yanchengensis]|uniref:Nuclease n=2 Tax=Pontibacillus yanchengensis TaxID=462910 RepID=A0ACC7VBL1_9BACI|nr:thermonuclease family protein [Pontibacillus yanchengensis]MYL34716.1 nuclease [Pontibacillus yanchengensis]MYL52298.1 nuclease [Pontibacillus yanchengensis]